MAQGPLLVIVGPTASGKTRLVELVAGRLAAAGVGVEAVACDAMQVYRGMDIGTDKPPPGPPDGAVEYHMIDVIEPTEAYSAARYQGDAAVAIRRIQVRGMLPVLVGGTGLYVRAVVDGLDFAPGEMGGPLRRRLEERAQREGPGVLYEELLARDPDAAGRIPSGNVRRVIRALEWLDAGDSPSRRHADFSRRPSRAGIIIVGLDLPREILRERISARVDEMLAAGLEAEVRGLWEAGRLGPTARQAIGYKELVEHLEGSLSWEDAVERIAARTRQYAKRQLTWFGRDERVTWVDASDIDAAAVRVAELAGGLVSRATRGGTP